MNVSLTSQSSLFGGFAVLDHRGLKLDGAIGQVEICNSLKSKIFENPSCPILEKIKENFRENNFLAIMKH